eukprot:gene7316-9968_t
MQRNYLLQTAHIDDAATIARLINEAYDCEMGDFGIAFKNSPRLIDPLEEPMRSAFENGRIIKAVDEINVIIGVIVWDLDIDSSKIEFGPFAVSRSIKRTGVGKLLLQEIERIGASKGIKKIEMSVINWRVDLIPMYEYLGFTKVSDVPFPHPDRLTRPSHCLIYQKDISLPLTNEIITTEINNSNYPDDDIIGSPWATINDMLIENRCWLCKEKFPRGKQKKVFQVSDLLQFFGELMLQELPPPPTLESENLIEDIITTNNLPKAPENDLKLSTAEVNNSESANSTINSINLTLYPGLSGNTLKSENLRRCYNSYKKLLLKDGGKGDELRSEFKNNDVEVWMSGLICAISEDCKNEQAYFITDKKKNSNSLPTSTKDGKMISDPKDCPPGCGCDNPWAFLS